MLVRILEGGWTAFVSSEPRGDQVTDKAGGGPARALQATSRAGKVWGSRAR